MTEQSRVGDMEIRHDPAFERWTQVVQRAAWAVIALIVLAALLGLFGSGPLSQAAVGPEGGPLRIEYDRFLRHQAPQRLEVRLGPGAAEGGKVRLWLSAEWLDGVELERVAPQPEGVELGPDGQTFSFAVSDPGEAVTVVFHFAPGQVGRLNGQAGLAGGEPVTFQHFVYP